MGTASTRELIRGDSRRLSFWHRRCLHRIEGAALPQRSLHVIRDDPANTVMTFACAASISQHAKTASARCGRDGQHWRLASHMSGHASCAAARYNGAVSWKPIAQCTRCGVCTDSL